MLFRLAARGLEILERHKDREPALSVFAQTLGVSASSFMELYDRMQVVAASQSAVTAGRNTAVAHLRRKLRGWVAILVNDIPGFDPSMYGDKPDVPEDMINDAKSIFTALAEHESAGGEAPFYKDTLIEDLQAAIDAARQEHTHAAGAHAGLAELRIAVREAASKLQADLVAFRRTLLAHVGRSHPDYQKLRVSQSRTLVVADEEESGPDSPGDSDSNATLNALVEDLLDDGADEPDALDQAS